MGLESHVLEYRQEVKETAGDCNAQVVDSYFIL